MGNLLLTKQEILDELAYIGFYIKETNNGYNCELFINPSSIIGNEQVSVRIIGHEARLYSSKVIGGMLSGTNGPKLDMEFTTKRILYSSLAKVSNRIPEIIRNKKIEKLLS